MQKSVQISFLVCKSAQIIFIAFKNVYKTVSSKLLYVWQKKVRVCNSVKRKYGQIFCQDWVSVKTYLMSFCHNSKIFCQTLVVTLTVCCSVKVYSHVWQNSLTVWQNLINVLVLFDRTTQKCLKNRKMSLSPIQIKILKNPRDKIW